MTLTLLPYFSPSRKNCPITVENSKILYNHKKRKTQLWDNSDLEYTRRWNSCFYFHRITRIFSTSKGNARKDLYTLGSTYIRRCLACLRVLGNGTAKYVVKQGRGSHPTKVRKKKKEGVSWVCKRALTRSLFIRRRLPRLLKTINH